MMGHRDILIDGLEYDVLYGRKYYCYLTNNYKLKSYAKNKINRRNRKKSKHELKEHIGKSYLMLNFNY